MANNLGIPKTKGNKKVFFSAPKFEIKKKKQKNSLQEAEKERRSFRKKKISTKKCNLFSVVSISSINTIHYNEPSSYYQKADVCVCVCAYIRIRKYKNTFTLITQFFLIIVYMLWTENEHFTFPFCLKNRTKNPPGHKTKKQQQQYQHIKYKIKKTQNKNVKKTDIKEISYWNAVCKLIR